MLIDRVVKSYPRQWKISEKFLHFNLLSILKLENNNIIIRVATAADVHFAETITAEMESPPKPGTGIAANALPNT